MVPTVQTTDNAESSYLIVDFRQNLGAIGLPIFSAIVHVSKPHREGNNKCKWKVY